MAIAVNSRGGEVVAQLLERRSITELPAFGRVLEQHHEQTVAIDAEPFIEPEKVKRKTALRDAAVAALDREIEKAIKDSTREFDQQEGQARAAARGDEWIGGPALPTPEEARQEERRFRRDQALTSEWSLRLTGVEHITDLAALEQLAEDAKLVNNPKIYRAAMQAITQQSGRLAAAERRKDLSGSIGPAQSAHSALSGDFASWLKANPTPGERVRQIASARQRQEDELRRSASLYRRAYGIDAVS